MECSLWKSRWLIVGVSLVLCGCASTILVEPEQDLAHEHRNEIAELRHEAIEFCGDGRGGVSDIQIRVKESDQGVRTIMQATCVDNDAWIRCDQVADGVATMTCEGFH